MNTGIVKWFNPDKGYGYIAVAPSVKLQHGIPVASDVYVHITSVVMKYPKVLQPDQRVAFTVSKGPKGFCALGVRVIDSPLRTPHSELRIPNTPHSALQQEVLA